MANEFYDHTTYPATSSTLASSPMRSELDSIEAGFDKLPTMAGNGGEIVAVNAGGSALEAITTTGTGSGVRATSPTLVTPALGTPSALVGTNITGTAAGLTAGNVTTNANLTGHVTSVGNAAVLGSFTAAQLNTALSDADIVVSGANSSITSLTGLTTPLSVAQGGTAGATAADARTALGAAKSGANSDITSLTALTAGGLPNNSVLTDDIADAQVTPAKLSQPLTSGTAVATTSGTSIDFTSIPSWVKRITVMLSGVSGSSTGDMSIRLGTASGFEATGYATATWTSNTNNTNFTTGFFLKTARGAADASSGHFVFTLVGSNTWVGSGTIARTDAADMSVAGGSKTLAGTLDRIQLVISSGAFDDGSMNILYEG